MSDIYKISEYKISFFLIANALAARTGFSLKIKEIKILKETMI
jgi:hypothetical protein